MIILSLYKYSYKHRALSSQCDIPIAFALFISATQSIAERPAGPERDRAAGVGLVANSSLPGADWPPFSPFFASFLLHLPGNARGKK